MSASRHERLSAIVSGRVQGVGFRLFVERRARAMGLDGYVRNLSDGRAVEIVAEGPREDLDELLRHIRRGPAGARVTDVDVRWSDADGALDPFHIR